MAKEQAAPRRLRVLVAEECAMFRDAMLRSLSMEPDLELVLACANPEEAFIVAARNPVDVVVLHDQTGSGSSARFLRGARRHGFTGRALVVTGDVKEPTVRQLIRLGAAGLLLRERRLSDLMESIHAIAAGADSFDGKLVRPMFESRERPAEGDPGRFSGRERMVLDEVLAGRTTKEIASRLRTSESTVKAALQRLFRKTGVRSRTQLIGVILESRQLPVG